MLTVHTLGDVDFLDLGLYMTDAEEDHGDNPHMEMVTNGFLLGDGARVTRRRITDNERVFHVICQGDDYHASDLNAIALEDELLIAFNQQGTASPITYVEQDESEPDPATWKALGGLFVRDYRLRGAQLVSGMLTIHRSKS